MKKGKITIISIIIIVLLGIILVPDAVKNVREDHVLELNKKVMQSDDMFLEDNLIEYVEYEDRIDSSKSSYGHISFVSGMRYDILNMYKRFVSNCGLGKEKLKYCTVDNNKGAYSLKETEDSISIEVYSNQNEEVIRYTLEYIVDHSLSISFVKNNSDGTNETGNVFNYVKDESLQLHIFNENQLIMFDDFNIEESISNYNFIDFSNGSEYIKVYDVQQNAVYEFDLVNTSYQNLSFMNENQDLIIKIEYIDNVVRFIKYNTDYVINYQNFYDNVCFIDGQRNTTSTYTSLCDAAFPDFLTQFVDENTIESLESVLALDGYELTFDELSMAHISTVLAFHTAKKSDYLEHVSFQYSDRNILNYSFSEVIELDENVLNRIK